MITQSMLNAQVEAANREYHAQCVQTHEQLPSLLKREYKRGYDAGYEAGLKAANTKGKPNGNRKTK